MSFVSCESGQEAEIRKYNFLQKYVPFSENPDKSYSEAATRLPGLGNGQRSSEGPLWEPDNSIRSPGVDYRRFRGVCFLCYTQRLMQALLALREGRAWWSDTSLYVEHFLRNRL